LNFFSLFKRNIIYQLKKKINIDSDGINFNNLDKLLNYYGSDKASFFKNKNTYGHGYSKFYEYYLNKFKNKKIKILEIGSFAGGSAAAFKKYFINSKIICFDINISNFKFYSKGIDVYGLDIKNYKKAREILKKIFIKNDKPYFDLIIDDGSHNLDDMLISFKNFFKFIKKGGFYIIEDFKIPNYHAYNKNINDILISEMLVNLKKKKIFKSEIIDTSFQKKLHRNIANIFVKKGKLKNSDICFINKK
tara:strand:+ start:1640 stop:2383 length:744 start_codon:yes stop_codon:yes gene_type:complete